jgi:hypothetical protein
MFFTVILLHLRLEKMLTASRQPSGTADEAFKAGIVVDPK